MADPTNGSPPQTPFRPKLALVTGSPLRPMFWHDVTRTLPIVSSAPNSIGPAELAATDAALAAEDAEMAADLAQLELLERQNSRMAQRLDINARLAEQLRIQRALEIRAHGQSAQPAPLVAASASPVEYDVSAGIVPVCNEQQALELDIAAQNRREAYLQSALNAQVQGDLDRQADQFAALAMSPSLPVAGRARSDQFRDTLSGKPMDADISDRTRKAEAAWKAHCKDGTPALPPFAPSQHLPLVDMFGDPSRKGVAASAGSFRLVVQTIQYFDRLTLFLATGNQYLGSFLPAPEVLKAVTTVILQTWADVPCLNRMLFSRSYHPQYDFAGPRDFKIAVLHMLLGEHFDKANTRIWKHCVDHEMQTPQHFVCFYNQLQEIRAVLQGGWPSFTDFSINSDLLTEILALDPGFPTSFSALLAAKTTALSVHLADVSVNTIFAWCQDSVHQRAATSARTGANQMVFGMADYPPPRRGQDRPPPALAPGTRSASVSAPQVPPSRGGGPRVGTGRGSFAGSPAVVSGPRSGYRNLFGSFDSPVLSAQHCAHCFLTDPRKMNFKQTQLLYQTHVAAECKPFQALQSRDPAKYTAALAAAQRQEIQWEREQFGANQGPRVLAHTTLGPGYPASGICGPQMAMPTEVPYQMVPVQFDPRFHLPGSVFLSNGGVSGSVLSPLGPPLYASAPGNFSAPSTSTSSASSVVIPEQLPSLNGVPP